MYIATMCGKVIGLKQKVLRTWVNNSGYEMFHLYDNGSRTSKYVHRFVYEQYKGEIPKELVVDHIDGNKLNNRVNNLQLLSFSDNIIKGKTGKISLTDREEIYKMYKEGSRQREVAEIYGVSQPWVSAIVKTFLKEGI